MKRYILFICCISYMCTFSQAVTETDRVKNIILEKCSEDVPEDISFQNISVTIENESKITVGVDVNTTIELDTPIKVDLVLKRKFVIGWYKIPCLDNVGSCTYTDICQYGTPTNEPCPPIFKENNLPCRCPIESGEYKIPIISVNVDLADVPLNGKYKGGIIISHKDESLACYNFSFEITNSLYHLPCPS